MQRLPQCNITYHPGFRIPKDARHALLLPYHAQRLRAVTGRELRVERWARLLEK